MEVITRKEAKEKGLKRYFTGIPCKYGHIGERYIGNGACIVCSSEIKTIWATSNIEYQKQYYLKNKERIRTKNKGRSRKHQYFYKSDYWINVTINSARARAKKFDLPFNAEDILELLSNASDTCPIFGTKYIVSKMSDESPSLDRIIPEKGYVKGNITVLSNLANRIKTNATSKQILKVGNWLENMELMSQKTD